MFLLWVASVCPSRSAFAHLFPALSVQDADPYRWHQQALASCWDQPMLASTSSQEMGRIEGRERSSHWYVYPTTPQSSQLLPRPLTEPSVCLGPGPVPSRHRSQPGEARAPLGYLPQGTVLSFGLSLHLAQTFVSSPLIKLLK